MKPASPKQIVLPICLTISIITNVFLWAENREQNKRLESQSRTIADLVAAMQSGGQMSRLQEWQAKVQQGFRDQREREQAEAIEELRRR